MVCNQNADIQVFQLVDDLLDILHSDGVYTCKGLVEHDELRLDGQTTGNLCTTAFTSRETVSRVLTHLLQTELGNELLELLQLVVTGLTRHLQHGEDIVLDTHLTEHRGFLGQIADTSTGSLVNRVFRHLLVAQVDMAAIGHHETCRHIERGGLSCTVRTQESHDLTLLHVEAHIIDHRTLSIALHEAFRA